MQLFWDSERAQQDEHFEICPHFFLERIFPQFAYWQRNELFFLFFSYFQYLDVKCTSGYSLLAEDIFRAFFYSVFKTFPLILYPEPFYSHYLRPLPLSPILNLSISFTINLSPYLLLKTFPFYLILPFFPCLFF